MRTHRIARRLLARVEASGGREALIGDLLEEIANGRSGFWVWQQLIAWGATALVVGAWRRTKLTPYLIMLGCGLLLGGAVSVSSLGGVLEAWIVFYLFSGTASLFAHVMARTAGGRTLVIQQDTGPDV
jgi:hypothetical protein